LNIMNVLPQPAPLGAHLQQHHLHGVLVPLLLVLMGARACCC
jgi:hypothetical protein